jgi:hypothetical protein
MNHSMNSRGRLIAPAASLALIACLAAGSLAAGANANPRHPVAAASKKCKRPHRSRKRHCKHNGAMAPAMISLSPASQDFGVPQIGGERRNFTVSNIGGSLSGVAVPILTQGGSDFSIAANGCTYLLSAGASCPVDVQVGTSGAGQVSATLTVTAIPGGTASASMTADIEA